MKPVFITPEGRLLSDTDLPKVKEQEAPLPFEVKVQREHARQSTHKPHEFTLHPTYRTFGCLICGKDEASHPGNP